MEKIEFEILSKESHLPIVGDIRYEGVEKKPLIIFIHGSRGYKDWGFFPFMSERLAQAGAIVATVNYSTDAIESDQHKIYSLDIYAKTTISQLVNETLQIIEYAKFGIIDEINDVFNGDVYLCGFSLGGGIALLTANLSPDVKKLCLIAPIGQFDRYSERLKKEWLDRGYWEMPADDLGQKIRLDSSYLADIIENKEKFDIADNLQRLKIQTSIFRGDIDRTVRESEIVSEIEKANNDRVHYELIDKANHTFGVSRNFIKETASLRILIEKTINFFKS